jgi:hypothetical protein
MSSIAKLSAATKEVVEVYDLFLGESIDNPGDKF